MNMNHLCRNKLFQATVALSLIGAASTASASCRTSALECAAAASGMLLTCGAAAAQLLADPVFDYNCAIVGAAAGGACAAMAEECIDDTTTNNPATTSGGSRGSLTGTKQTLTCGNASTTSPYLNRVTGIYAKRDTVNGLTLVSSIRMNCASGSAVFIGNDGTSGTTWNGGVCSNGRLVQGITVNSGSFIDAIGRICDNVSFSSTDSDNFPSLLYGGGGGTQSVLKCPENKYMWGMNVWYDGTQPLGNRIARGIEILCRGY